MLLVTPVSVVQDERIANFHSVVFSIFICVRSPLEAQRDMSRWVFLVIVCHPCPVGAVQKVSVSFRTQNLLPCQHYFLPHASPLLKSDPTCA